MLQNFRHSLKKLALVATAAFAISVFASSASANALYDLGDGLTLSCGSSAGNYIIYGSDYLHGGVWQFIADMMCE
jgi:hypothetical protein